MRLNAFTGTEIGLATGEVFDAHAITVWAFKKQIVDALKKQINETLIDDSAAVATKDRAPHERVLLASVLAVEREECWHIERAAQQGTSIPYRTDIGARAWLCLSDAMPAPAAA